MRIFIHLWLGLTLVLGIYGDDMAKRAAEGSGSGDGLPITDGTTSDDEDYPQSYSDSYLSASDYGSDYESSGASSSYSESDSTVYTPSEDNSIKMRGSFTVHRISGGEIEWMSAFSDRSTDSFKQMSNLISPMIQKALESKKTTKKGLQNVKIISFKHGSLITEYEATYSPDSTVTEDQIRKSLKDAISNSNFGKLEVDPRSVSSVSAIRPSSVVVDPEATTQPPVKTDPPKVPTTQSNAINDRTEAPPKKPDTGGTNEVDPIIIDETPEDGEEVDDKDNNMIGNNMERGDENPEAETQNFWDKLFSHPLILAGLVGAVVIALLTVVLLLMFIVYRIKKKDEGSYSLDEPHKVKDPMAYWKDTKEFYA